MAAAATASDDTAGRQCRGRLGGGGDGFARSRLHLLLTLPRPLPPPKVAPFCPRRSLHLEAISTLPSGADRRLIEEADEGHTSSSFLSTLRGARMASAFLTQRCAHCPTECPSHREGHIAPQGLSLSSVGACTRGNRSCGPLGCGRPGLRRRATRPPWKALLRRAGARVAATTAPPSSRFPRHSTRPCPCPGGMPLHPLLTGHPYRPPARPAPPLRGPPLPLETVAATVWSRVRRQQVRPAHPEIRGRLQRSSSGGSRAMSARFPCCQALVLTLPFLSTLLIWPWAGDAKAAVSRSRAPLRRPRTTPLRWPHTGWA